MKFKISEQRWRHSGPTDPYWEEVATVEAESIADAPRVFAESKGFPPSTVVLWFTDRFDLGTTRYAISPA